MAYVTWSTCIIFVLPTTSMERLNVHTLYFVHWLITRGSIQKMQKLGQVGAWTRSPDLFFAHAQTLFLCFKFESRIIGQTPSSLERYLVTPKARKVCVSMWCAIVLTGTRCQLDDVSVCCEESVGMVQGCEWHWRILGEAPYGTSLISDDSMWFLQSLGLTARAVAWVNPQTRSVL